MRVAGNGQTHSGEEEGQGTYERRRRRRGMK
jgi:hypothetical protein